MAALSPHVQSATMRELIDWSSPATRGEQQSARSANSPVSNLPPSYQFTWILSYASESLEVSPLINCLVLTPICVVHALCSCCRAGLRAGGT